MNIYTKFEKQKNPTAVALGYFDGIHIGHQKVINTTVELKNCRLSPTVFTFSSGPQTVLFGKSEQKIITLDQKKEILSAMGVENLYIINFVGICKLTAEEFVKTILANTLNARAVVCGFNYHFGNGAAADAQDLEKICNKFDIETKIIKPVLYENKPISSTRIRKHINENDIENAKNMLGNKFNI